MTTYRELHPSTFLRADDLGGKDRTFTIKGIDFNGEGWLNGRKERATIVYFLEIKKGIILNQTNHDTVAFDLGYGKTLESWVGKRITLYPTIDNRIREKDKSAVRVRPSVPSAPGGAGAGVKEQPAQKSAAAEKPAGTSPKPVGVGGAEQKAAPQKTLTVYGTNKVVNALEKIGPKVATSDWYKKAVIEKFNHERHYHAHIEKHFAVRSGLNLTYEMLNAILMHLGKAGDDPRWYRPEEKKPASSGPADKQKPEGGDGVEKKLSTLGLSVLHSEWRKDGLTEVPESAAAIENIVSGIEGGLFSTDDAGLKEIDALYRGTVKAKK